MPATEKANLKDKLDANLQGQRVVVRIVEDEVWICFEGTVVEFTNTYLAINNVYYRIGPDGDWKVSYTGFIRIEVKS